MSAKLGRRTFTQRAGAIAMAAALPMPAIAQDKPIKIGLLTVKTGPLAQGGIQMEQGINLFLKDRGNTLAGRKVELLVGDTGGNPAGTKTKAQELIERDKVDMIFGPLAAFELLAISDYVAAHKTPILSLAAAEDMTQRKPNPYFVRASGTSAQCMHALADYAAKELKYKRVITITEDFAFGYEQMGGFQRVFEDAGGKRGEEAVAADRDAGLHALHRAARRRRCRGPGLRRLQSAEVHEAVQGRGPRRCRCSAAGPAMDDALLKSFGDEAVGRDLRLGLHGRPRHAEQQAASSRAWPTDYGNVPGRLCRRPLHQRHGAPRRRWRRLGGKTDDKEALIKALRAVSLDRHAARAVPLRPFRQRRRQRLHPPLRAQGRQAGQHDDQDLPERQPVLDLRREVVPGAAGLLARLSAAEELSIRR